MRKLAITLFALLFLLVACGGDATDDAATDDAATDDTATAEASPAETAMDEASPDDSPAAGAEFTPMEEGVLTVGTELPAPPFWIGDSYDSITGGFEYDLAQELATRLGLDEAVIVEMPFAGLVAGQQCPCDVDFSQVTITDERAEAVDFTSPYFDANQGILVNEGTEVPDLEAARALRWGAQVNTTGADYITSTIQPETPPQIYNTTVDAFNALRAGQIDAVLLDVPIVAGEAAQEGSTFEVVGQFETGEQYGGVLAKDDPNTAAISEVIDEMREDGFLDELSAEYFPEAADVPTLG